MRSSPQHLAFIHLALAAKEQPLTTHLADKVTGRVVIDRLRERVMREQQRRALQEELAVVEELMQRVAWPSDEHYVRAQQRVKLLRNRLQEEE